MNKPNTKLNSFLKGLQKPKVVKPAPKFSVGDIIMNQKFKVISKVINITGLFETEEGGVEYEAAQYVLEDVKNEAYENYINTTILDPDIKREYLNYRSGKTRKRYKSYSQIDFGYIKLDPAAARILYGVRTNEQD